MRIENEFLTVELDPDFPSIISTIYKPSGMIVHGADAGGTGITIDGRKTAYTVQSSGDGGYALAVRDPAVEISCRYVLDGSSIIFRLEQVTGGPVKMIGFDGTCAARVGDTWHYRRKKFTRKAWDRELGPGLFDGRHETGLVGQAIPDGGPSPTTFACVWNDALCITATSTARVAPLELVFEPGAHEGRAGSASLRMTPFQVRAGDQPLTPVEFRTTFLQDLNCDGKVDYGDAALLYRRSLPDPNPLYREHLVYKLFCASPGKVFATFDQCLDIIRLVNRVSDGMPQIVYLVGWQYDGHDTGYPSFDVVNGKLGGKEGLFRLRELARESNATISYHINVDDAYEPHPGWDPDIMTRDPDGSVRRWEVFNGVQSYHISHTKDVSSGKIFDRLRAMFAVAPAEKSIHLDAFRITNESWEPDGHLSMTDELELGVKPIVAFLRSNGLDPTCESDDSYPAEMAGVLSMVWHTSDPLLHFGRMLGGGRGETFAAWAAGNSTNTDFGPELDFGRIADMVYLGTKLYNLYTTREVLDVRADDPKNLSKTFRGGSMTADAGKETLSVIWDGIEVARNWDRFIPESDDLIYAYSKYGGTMTWELPERWLGKRVRSVTITPEGPVPGPDLRIEGRSVSFTVPVQRPIKLMLD